MNLHPFLPIFHARSNSTGRIGSKSIEIDTHFEQYFMPGQIGSKSIEIDTHFEQYFKNLHPFRAVFHARSNSTGRIGSKSIEIDAS